MLRFIQSVFQFFFSKAKSLAALWTLLIFLACFIPSKELEMPVPLNDKVAHFVLFAGFSCLWLMAFRVSGWRGYLLVFLIGCVFGWLIEELQGLLYFLGRSRDWMDVVADTIGSAIGLPLYALLQRFLPAYFSSKG